MKNLLRAGTLVGFRILSEIVVDGRKRPYGKEGMENYMVKRKMLKLMGLLCVV